ncbi:MAG: L-fucose/L-arabinose isomerase family protein [Candidatus Omnitrophica bacterium]|nr:L-fucose/L-arabinose isomerase family protein [Candidatus Omnitrophota bacterium]
MKTEKTTFALFFGNRGFFPASFMAEAREELVEVLTKLGHKTLLLDEKATRYGAVETVKEGRVYAEFLRKNRGKFGGVILSLPNFGDETGAVEALKEAGVPILIQAYPDELDKMSPALRRDAFCGKFSIMDVFCQYGIPFTALKPHTVHPQSPKFAENIDYFDRMCRVVNGMKGMIVGAIGARTTPFKTVRIDELALQKNGITMETFDLLSIFHRMEKIEMSDSKVIEKYKMFNGYADWKGVPKKAFENIVKLSVIIDEMIEEYGFNAVAIRCWIEMQEVLGISPCVILSELNNRGIPAACEVDIGNAVTMFVLSRASGKPAACLDWNNNYGEEEDKCILFHCGPVPADMMAGKGKITDHAILANSAGEGKGYGCNTGRITPGPFTFGSMLTLDGELEFYLGEGRFTDDPIPDDFFGCAGVAEIENLQDVLQTIGYRGHRHHTSVTPGNILSPVKEAFERYLGYKVVKV